MKPNILFLFPDQHRGDWLPFDGKMLEKLGIEKLPIKMPNLQKIMDKGVTFTRAITPSPLCAPARACLASGKQYEECRVPGNNFDYPLDLPTFYTALKETGYSVGGVGKFDVHKKTMWWGLDGWIDDLATLGFTHAIDNAGKLDAGNSAKIKPCDPYMAFLDKHCFREYHSKDITTRKHSVEPTLLPDELYCDNWLSQNALNMLEDFPKDKPWFLQVNFTGPHDPFDITVSMREKWKNVQFDMPHACPENEDTNKLDMQGLRQNYAAMLENIDARIGDMIEKITDMGQLDNTIIVYASDHGEMLGDFGKFGKSKPERGSVHIPMIISTPNMTEAKINNSLVELQDLTNTFMDFAKTSLSTATGSISLVPILENKTEKHRDCQNSALGKWKTVITENQKKIFINGKLEKVFDITKDVWEDNNLV